MRTFIAITLLSAAATSGLGGERHLRAYLATRQRDPMVGAIAGYLFAARFVFVAVWLVWKG